MEKIENELEKLIIKYGLTGFDLESEDEKLRQDDYKEEIIANEQQRNVERSLRVQETNGSIEKLLKKSGRLKGGFKLSNIIAVLNLLASLVLIIFYPSPIMLIVTLLLSLIASTYSAEFVKKLDDRNEERIFLMLHKQSLTDSIKESRKIIAQTRSKVMTSGARMTCVAKRTSILDELETLEVKIYNLLNSVPESKESDYIKGVRETFKPKYADLPTVTKPSVKLELK